MVAAGTQFIEDAGGTMLPVLIAVDLQRRASMLEASGLSPHSFLRAGVERKRA